MDQKYQGVDAEGDEFSVEKCKLKLELQPDDVELREKLADALTARYMYGEGEEGEGAGNQADIESVREIARDLPGDRALHNRAYLAYIDGKEDEFAEWLAKSASAFSQESDVPFSSDELLLLFVIPFGFSLKLWQELAGGELVKRCRLFCGGSFRPHPRVTRIIGYIR